MINRVTRGASGYKLLSGVHVALCNLWRTLPWMSCCKSLSNAELGMVAAAA
jgi:hypothetical protein